MTRGKDADGDEDQLRGVEHAARVRKQPKEEGPVDAVSRQTQVTMTQVRL